MSEKRYIHIPNWDRFQHRDVTRNKDRAAAWIKDHVAQLDDDEWCSMSQAQCGILHGLRLMYAARRGRGISEAEAKRKLCRSGAEKRHWLSNIESLNHAGLLAFSASKLPADGAHAASVDVDTDEDGDQEKEKNNPGLTVVSNDDWLAQSDTNGQREHNIQHLQQQLVARFEMNA